MKPRRLAEIILTFTLLFVIAQPEKRAMSPEDLYQIKAISDPQVSPDGKWIAYTVATPDLAKDRYFDDIWLVPVDGGVSKPLTTHPENDYSPRWSPDGKRIAFISERNGVSNLFLISLDGGEAKQVTFSETELYSPIWSKDGRHIICGSRVLPAGKGTIENWTKNELPECNARSIDRLLFRQWDTWLGDERNHVFFVDMNDGSMKDLTPGDFDTPPVSLSSSHDFDISPDGAEVCFTKTEGEILAISTNHDLFTVDIPTGKTTKITSNPALDGQPYYSPDGRYIAFVSMTKVNYESDREVLTLYDRKTGITTRLTEKLDRSVGQILWSPDSRQLYFTAEDQGHGAIYTVDLAGNLRKITDDGFNTHLDITPDGETLIYRKSYDHAPYEIYSQPTNGEKPTQLTWANREFDETFDLPPVEIFRFPGANGDIVHGFLL
ncbi:MAG: DPP IV N-terminal domain-containing protein, partial [Candidatus Marinimicrobia bacterium]|nr:DPP IV N-terminal domain-containing protein [Candidatus Neomarinimicrobiota bacterium]